MNSPWKSFSSIVSRVATSVLNTAHTNEFIPKSFMSSLVTLHRRHVQLFEGFQQKKTKRPFDGKPYAKGIILKTLIKKPRKPNSSNRKCVLVRLSNKKEMVAYVPGVGHNLQEHQSVLCRVGRLKDVPGVKIKCVRGALDLQHVKANK